MQDPQTTEEKIDYIYNVIKRQERNKKVKFYLKIGSYILIYFFIFVYIPYYIDLKIQQIKDTIPGLNKTIEITSDLKGRMYDFFGK